MTKLMRGLAFAALSGGMLLAQDLTGTWQGTLSLPGGRELRTVIKVEKADGAALRATMYSIDQGGQGIPVNPVTLQGTTVKMAMPGIGGSYEGKMEAAGDAITGNWKQGPNALALNLKRATAQNKSTAVGRVRASVSQMTGNSVCSSSRFCAREC